jgi:hypothetical protein
MLRYVDDICSLSDFVRTHILACKTKYHLYISAVSCELAPLVPTMSYACPACPVKREACLTGVKYIERYEACPVECRFAAPSGGFNRGEVDLTGELSAMCESAPSGFAEL